MLGGFRRGKTSLLEGRHFCVLCCPSAQHTQAPFHVNNPPYFVTQIFAFNLAQRVHVCMPQLQQQLERLLRDSSLLTRDSMTRRELCGVLLDESKWAEAWAALSDPACTVTTLRVSHVTPAQLVNTCTALRSNSSTREVQLTGDVPAEACGALAELLQVRSPLAVWPALCSAVPKPSLKQPTAIHLTIVVDIRPPQASSA